MTSTPTQGLDAGALDAAAEAIAAEANKDDLPEGGWLQYNRDCAGAAISAYLAALPASSGDEDLDLRDGTNELIRRLKYGLDQLRAEASRDVTMRTSEVFRLTDGLMDALFAAALSTSAKRGPPNPTEQSSSPADVDRSIKEARIQKRFLSPRPDTGGGER